MSRCGLHSAVWRMLEGEVEVLSAMFRKRKLRPGEVGWLVQGNTAGDVALPGPRLESACHLFLFSCMC